MTINHDDNTNRDNDKQHKKKEILKSYLLPTKIIANRCIIAILLEEPNSLFSTFLETRISAHPALR